MDIEGLIFEWMCEIKAKKYIGVEISNHHTSTVCNAFSGSNYYKVRYLDIIQNEVPSDLPKETVKIYLGERERLFVVEEGD